MALTFKEFSSSEKWETDRKLGHPKGFPVHLGKNARLPVLTSWSQVWPQPVSPVSSYGRFQGRAAEQSVAW